MSKVTSIATCDHWADYADFAEMDRRDNFAELERWQMQEEAERNIPAYIRLRFVLMAASFGVAIWGGYWLWKVIR